jgi:hypothetical protein
MMKSDQLYITSMVFTAVALVAVLYLFKRKKDTKEGFAGLGVSFKVKADRELVDNQGYFYSVPPNLQGALAPRFSSTGGYGPWLNTKMPARNMQGVPVNPLTFQNTIKKCDNGVNVFNSDMKMNGYGYPSDTKEGFDSIPPNFSASNYQQADNSLPARSNVIVNDMLPEMASEAATAVAQPIVYDRYMYANQRSRLYGLGDPIRGDLPIVPYNGDWFRPSVQPNIDLRDGAMMVLAGQDNATARNTMALMRASSGDTMGTFAGAPVMATQSNVGYGAGGADVIATAFP